MSKAPLPIWDRQFLELAHAIGGWSKDRSAKTGCIIVDSNKLIRSTGYNGFVRGIDDDIDQRHERPAKYSWTEHAERNAIYNAARLGISLEGCIAYVNWFPCVECARALVQVGVIRLVGIAPDQNDSKWGPDFKLSLEMFAEAKVELSLHCVPGITARVRG